MIDDEVAPEPKYREIALGKLVVALLIEGAIFRVLRGLADHGARHGFARLTGEWPGDERPDQHDHRGRRTRGELRSVSVC